MDQFIHLPEHRVVICRKCQYAVLPSEIDAHFTKKPEHALDKPSRRRITNAVAEIDGLISNGEVLQHGGFQFPPSTSEAIPELLPPRRNGLRCKFNTNDGLQCPYVSSHREKIQKHCREIHQWENPKRKGRPRAKEKEQPVPWETDISCQRFFIQGPYSRYFEVQRSPEGIKIEEPWEKAQRIIGIRMAKAEEKQRRIEVTDESQEANPWLRRVGWARHLEDLNRTDLMGLVAEIDEETEPVLSIIKESFNRVIITAQQTARVEVVGSAALFRINGVEYERKGTTPFPAFMEDGTEAKYSSVWEKLLCFVIRAENY
jgi:hypothetical protein